MTERATLVHQIRIDGSSLDAALAERLLEGARAACASGARALVVDLAGIERLDSWGISALLTLRKRTPADVKVALASMSAATQKIARVTHLHDIFDIYSNAETAVEDLSA